MSDYVVTRRAQRDLIELVDYIAMDNPDAAERLGSAIVMAFETLSAAPGMGHARPDLTLRPVRFWTVAGRYTVVYREASAIIEIVRVFGPGRDMARQLS